MRQGELFGGEEAPRRPTSVVPATNRRLASSLSLEEVRQLCDDYIAGFTSLLLRDKWGISKKQVLAILRRNGVAIRDRSESQAVYKFDRGDVLRRYESGERIKDIAASLGVPRKTISSTIGNRERAGGVRRRSVAESSNLCAKWSFNRDLAIQLYRDGLTLSQIGGRLGVPYLVVRSTLGNRKVPRRTAQESATLRRIHTCNERSFDSLTEEALYWLGFLAADGNVPLSMTQVQLQLQTKDREHLLLFRDFVGSDAPIKEMFTTLKATGKTYTGLRLTVHSARIATALRTYGITPAKTYTLQAAPELAGEPAFWRGLIDGDGSVGLAGGKVPTISLTGSKGILEQWLAFVRSIAPTTKARVRTNGNAYRLALKSDPARAVIETLYPPGCFPSLQRKDATARKCLLWARRQT